MDDVKRICIVSAQYLPHMGGVENYVSNLSAELAGRGHFVTIVTSQNQDAPDFQQNGNVEIFRLPSYLFMNGRFPVLKHGKKLRAFQKAFCERHFDLMFVNVRFYLLSLYAVRLAKKQNIPCVLMDHGSGHIKMGGALTTKLGEWYEHLITFLEKRSCKRFACVSKEGTKWVKHFGIETDIVLPNAVSVEWFEERKKADNRNFRSEYQIPEEAVVISFVGRMVAEKGIHELMEAVKMLHSEQVWLIAAGDGPIAEELTAKPEHNMIFVGRLPREDVVALLLQSDIYCLPTIYPEGFPTSVLEAAMCHAFVITTIHGDSKEIIKSPEYGIVLPDNHPKHLSEAISSVLDRADIRKAAAERCYREVTEHYTWERTADKLLALIDDPNVHA